MRSKLTFSQIKWQLISICLERSWKEGLVERWMVAWLMQKIIAETMTTSKSLIKATIHVTSLAKVAKAQYSTSVEEQDTVACFLDL